MLHTRGGGARSPDSGLQSRLLNFGLESGENSGLQSGETPDWSEVRDAQSGVSPRFFERAWGTPDSSPKKLRTGPKSEIPSPESVRGFPSRPSKLRTPVRRNPGLVRSQSEVFPRRWKTPDSSPEKCRTGPKPEIPSPESVRSFPCGPGLQSEEIPD